MNENPDATEARRATATKWFEALRDEICSAFEAAEDALAAGPHAAMPAGRFQRRTWLRQGGGGGVISLMTGRVFEKVGVNVSTVWGEFSPEFRTQIPGAADDPLFWASGISLVAHLRSPKIPAVHMNTRHIVTTRSWFGGGTDLNPMVAIASDTADFHAVLRATCDRHDRTYYPRFSKWCDEYFFNKHRDEPRGVGGIFFDNLDSGDWARDFAFTQDVGRSFLDAYMPILRRHLHEPWTAEDREHQLVRRGRYAEFNLVYDRGTRFGLMTGGNPEAVLMSLPPLARWP
jgi:coproporphyrinogen III oxidase